MRKLAAPLLYPGKVLCAGANYYDHMAEMGFPGTKKETQRLFFFFKPPRNAVVGPGATVVDAARHQEIRLGDRACGGDRQDRALRDRSSARSIMSPDIRSRSIISARDFNQAPDQFYKFDWVAGKATDTACPMGPWIVPAEALGDRAERRAEALGQRRRQAGQQHAAR